MPVPTGTECLGLMKVKVFMPIRYPPSSRTWFPTPRTCYGDHPHPSASPHLHEPGSRALHLPRDGHGPRRQRRDSGAGSDAGANHQILLSWRAARGAAPGPGVVLPAHGPSGQHQPHHGCGRECDGAAALRALRERTLGRGRLPHRLRLHGSTRRTRHGLDVLSRAVLCSGPRQVHQRGYDCAQPRRPAEPEPVCVCAE